MAGPLAPALIAAGANIIGGGLSAWQSRRNVKDTNRANVRQADIAYQRNKELAQYTFDKNLEMWKMQNKYNAPGAQMQRLQEAGLNPHLMYGKGTVGNAQGMPQMQQTPYVAPRIDFSGRQSAIGTMAQAGLGTVSQMVQLQRAKEDLSQAQINTWVQENTKNYKLIKEKYDANNASMLFDGYRWENDLKKWRSKIEEIKSSYWNEGINPNDQLWVRLLFQFLGDIGDDTLSQKVKGMFGEKFMKNINDTLEKYKP